VAAVLAVVFLAWTLVDRGEPVAWLTSAAAAVLLVAALAADRAGRDGWAFSLTGGTIACAVITLFVVLFPDVMPSTTDPAFSLNVDNASSTDYTLKVMTWVAVVMTPIVLVYQGWTFWVFRRRIGTQHIPPEVVHPKTPVS
jgi:cytochrome d ubiquinol oxidase subunit II